MGLNSPIPGMSSAELWTLANATVRLQDESRKAAKICKSPSFPGIVIAHSADRPVRSFVDSKNNGLDKVGPFHPDS
jgi:hypothetical protein